MCVYIIVYICIWGIRKNIWKLEFVRNSSMFPYSCVTFFTPLAILCLDRWQALHICRFSYMLWNLHLGQASKSRFIAQRFTNKMRFSYGIAHCVHGCAERRSSRPSVVRLLALGLASPGIAFVPLCPPLCLLQLIGFRGLNGHWNGKSMQTICDFPANHVWLPEGNHENTCTP